MKNELPDNAGVIAPPPLIFAVTLAAGLLLHGKFPVRSALSLPRIPRFVLGGSLIGLAVTIIPLAFRTLRRAQTNVDPREPTTAIVVAGHYRFTRNPIYLSFALLYAGIATLFNGIGAMLLFPAFLLFIRRGAIDREERYLERKFGERYLNYKRRVPRWI